MTVNSDQQTITHNNTTVHLSPRETQLAAALIAGGTSPTSKDTLLRVIWKNKGDMNTVEVYAGYLRRKLREGFGTAVQVDTVARSGYRLVTDNTAPAG